MVIAHNITVDRPMPIAKFFSVALFRSELSSVRVDEGKRTNERRSKWLGNPNRNNTYNGQTEKNQLRPLALVSGQMMEIFVFRIFFFFLLDFRNRY